MRWWYVDGWVDVLAHFWLTAVSETDFSFENMVLGPCVERSLTFLQTASDGVADAAVANAASLLPMSSCL